MNLLKNHECETEPLIFIGNGSLDYGLVFINITGTN